jgi:hypothetical protein
MEESTNRKHNINSLPAKMRLQVTVSVWLQVSLSNRKEKGAKREEWYRKEL